MNKKNKESTEKPEFKKTSLKKETKSVKVKKKVKKNTGKKILKKAPKKDKDVDLSVDNEKESAIEEELHDIYKNDDGSMPDMYNFKRKKRNRITKAFLFLSFSCLFLVSVAWLGFFVFQPKMNFMEKDIILSVSGEESVLPGDEITYRIRYVNAQSIALTNVGLQINYPDGFEFSSADKDPVNDANTIWELKNLQPGQSDYINITGKMYGDVGKKQSFRVFLNYTPINFSSEFQKVETITVEFIEPSVVLSVEYPEEVTPGFETEFLIETEEASQEDVLKDKKIGIVVESDENFSLLSAESEFKEIGDKQWMFDFSNIEDVIKINGIFNSVNDEKNQGNIHFYLALFKDGEFDNDFYILAKKEIQINLLESDLSLQMAINGSVSDFPVQPGEILNISISVKNSGQSEIDDLNAKLVVETPSYNNLSMLDWRELQDEADGDIIGEQVDVDTRRGYIYWDSSHISNLYQVAPGEERVINLSIPFKDVQDIDLTGFKNYEASVFAEVEYRGAGEEKVLTTNQINMVVNSDLSFEVRDGVSENSEGFEVHDISWILNNNFHDLKDIELSADFYGDIVWNNDELNVPAGEAVFDESSGKLIWKIDEMPVGLDVLALQFQIISKNDNPTQTNLSSKVKVQALDMVTGQKIIKVGKEIFLNNFIQED